MKNRYCRRTKLSEDAFLFILSGFCVGLTATETRAAIQDQGIKISRQTVEQKFLEIGNYVYGKFTKPIFLKLIHQVNPGIDLPDDELERHILDEMWNHMRGELDYTKYRGSFSPYPGHEQLMQVLRERWRMFNGFTRDKFTSHIGYATYYDHANKEGGTPERAFEVLKIHLERDPL